MVVLPVGVASYALIFRNCLVIKMGRPTGLEPAKPFWAGRIYRGPCGRAPESVDAEGFGASNVLNGAVINGGAYIAAAV
jgi:hypothetical protein